MAWKRKDIWELRLQDEARGKGRKRADPEKVLEHRQLLGDMKTLLQIRDEVTFLKTLINDYELPVDSDCYRQAVEVWKAFQRNRGRSYD